PLAALEMPPADCAVLALGINEVRVAGIDTADKTVTAADVDPVLVDDTAAFTDRRAAPRGVVLQSADDPVPLLEADRDVIELAECGRVDVVPVAAAIVAGIEAAVTADWHVEGVAGVCPK